MLTALEAIQALPGVNGGSNPHVTTQCSRGDLCRLFAALGFTRGAEIGVWEGHFSEQLCATIPGLHLTCVDPWQPYAAYREKKNDPVRLEAAYRTTVTRLAPYHCVVARMISTAAAAKVPDRSLDFVYVDGNHEASHVRADLRAWTPKIRQGGILAGHDYRDNWARPKPYIQVKAAVDAFTAERGIDPWFVFAREKSPSFLWVVA